MKPRRMLDDPDVLVPLCISIGLVVVMVLVAVAIANGIYY